METEEEGEITSLSPFQQHLAGAEYKIGRLEADTCAGAEVHDAASLEASLVSQFEHELDEREKQEKRRCLEQTLTRLQSRLNKKLKTKESNEVAQIREKLAGVSGDLAALDQQPERPVGDANVSQIDTEKPLLLRESSLQSPPKGNKGNSLLFPYLRGDHIVPKTQLQRFVRNVQLPFAARSPSDVYSRGKRIPNSEIRDDTRNSDYHNRLIGWIDGMSGRWNVSQDIENREADVMDTASCSSWLDSFCWLHHVPAHDVDDEFVIPLGLWEALLPHQQEAVLFLWTLDQQKTGGLLADEMGLGKTVELAAFIAALHFTAILQGLHTSSTKRMPGAMTSENATAARLVTHHNGTLIICPATVVPQWLEELHSWYPPLRCYTVSGKGLAERRRIAKCAAKFGCVLIMSYETVRSDITFMKNLPYSYVVLDEGQKIRNPEANITVAVKKFRTTHRVILSGTPIQNDLRELWSLFDFIAPNRLGSLAAFTENFADPIRLGGLSSASRAAAFTAYTSAAALRSIIAPHLLRRTKADLVHVITLPDKAEQVLFCHLSPAQYQIYVDFLEAQSPFRPRTEGGSAKISPLNRNHIFFALSILRKICNHPDLLLLHQSSDVEVPDFGAKERSGKLQVALNVLRSWKEEGHRVLLFSQTVQVLNVMEPHLKDAGYSFRRIDGTTPMGKRAGILSEFQEDTSIFLLLMTTRVGGVGLNLTSANRLIIFDPDWNPMTDAQARERSWRIGQTKNVVVYRLIMGGTIEEKMYQRQIYKHFLSQRVLVNPKQKRYFKLNDLRELFQMPPCPPSLRDPQMLDLLRSTQYHKLVHRAIKYWEGQCSTLVQLPVEGSSEQLSDASELWNPEGGVDESETTSAVEESGIEVDRLSRDLSETSMSNSDQPDADPIPKRRRVAVLESTYSNLAQQAVASPCRDTGSSLRSVDVIETKAGIPQRLGYPKPENVVLPTPKSDENKLVTTLLDRNSIQGFLSHDIFELSNPDFDLDQRESMKRTARAVEAIGGDIRSVPFLSKVATPPVEDSPRYKSPQASVCPLTPAPMSLMEELRRRAQEQATCTHTSWSALIRQKLRNFFAVRGSSTTDAILQEFGPDVADTTAKDRNRKIEFKRILKEISSFDQTTGVWMLRN